MYSYNSYHKVILILGVIIWAIYHFQSNDDNNLNHGVWTWYHSNGNIQLTGLFIDGKRNGIWKNYDASGSLTSESTYKDDQLNGKFTRYDKSGRVLVQQYFINDQL